ncbi:MAG: putative membrane protein [Bradymonadia bacterium]|jgi:uncharacterized membrane protein
MALPLPRQANEQALIALAGTVVMSESENSPVLARLEALEAEVGALRDEVATLRATPPAPGPTTSDPAQHPYGPGQSAVAGYVPGTQRPDGSAQPGAGPNAQGPAGQAWWPERTTPGRAKPARTPRRERKPVPIEDWLTRLGIVLVVLGAAFFLAYAIDQGWVSETLRLVIGAVLGAGLLGGAVKLHSKRENFGAALLGGAVAVWAATIWTGANLYGLIPETAGTALLALDVAVALFFALRWNNTPMAVLGLAGAYAIPFVIEAEAPNAIGFAAWYVVTTALAAGIYVRRTWRALLWTSAGASIIWFVTASGIGFFDGDMVVAGLLMTFGAWTVFALVPAIRAFLIGSSTTSDIAGLSALSWPMSVATTCGALGAVDRWSSFAVVAAFALGAIALTAGCTLRRLERLAAGHALGASVLVVTAVGIGTLDFGYSAVALSALSLVALLTLRSIAHLRFVGVLWLLAATLAAFGGMLDNYRAPFGEDWAVVVGGFATIGVWWMLAATALRAALGKVALFAATGTTLLGTLGMFGPLHAAAIFTGVCWAVLGGAQVVAGIRLDHKLLKALGGGVFVMLAAKLLLIDMSNAPIILRMALFGGLGFAILAFSWFLPKLAGKPPAGTPPPSGR